MTALGARTNANESMSEAFILGRERGNQAHKEEEKGNFLLLAHPLHSVCPNSPFPFTLEHLPGRLKLGPHVSFSVDTDVRLTFNPDFFVYSLPLLILTTSGHFRTFIILFNYEVKLIVKLSFLNTVHPLWGLFHFKHIWGGGGGV